MENFSQEDEEKELEKTGSNAPDIDDIQFEETFDVDKLQAELQKKIDSGDFSEKSAKSDESLEAELGFKPTGFSEIPLVNEPQVEIDANAKKYVIYINPDNINYMENLSTNERKILINKILKEQNTLSAKQKELERTKKYTVNLIIVIVTIIISFPIIFFLVNKGLEITIKNYNTAKGNFTKLYKEKGRIKQTGSSQENIKY